MSSVNLYIVATLLASVILSACEYFYPDHYFSTLFAVSPAIIAFTFASVGKERPLRSLGWHPNFLFWLKILGFITAMTTILLLIAWFLGHTEINEKALKKFLKFSTLVELLIGVAINTGEEVGWRGYMFPKLYKQWGWWPSVLVSSLIWWAWHVPFMAVLQVRHFGEIQWGTQAIQLVGMFPATILLSYWFLRSRSFWVIGFAHQLTNFVNKWFLGLEHTKKNPIFFQNQSFTHLYSLENGILGVVVLCISAIVVYLKNKSFCLQQRDL